MTMQQWISSGILPQIQTLMIIWTLLYWERMDYKTAYQTKPVSTLRSLTIVHFKRSNKTTIIHFDTSKRSTVCSIIA